MTEKTDKIGAAVVKRQEILDFLVANPRSPARHIGAATGMSTEAAGYMIRDMIDAGEVQKHGNGRASVYTACKSTTKSADEIRARLKLHAGTKKPHADAPRRNKDFPRSAREGVLGVTTNNPSKHKPHPNQGGQLATSSALRSSQMATCKVSM